MSIFAYALIAALIGSSGGLLIFEILRRWIAVREKNQVLQSKTWTFVLDAAPLRVAAGVTFLVLSGPAAQPQSGLLHQTPGMAGFVYLHRIQVDYRPN
jgi:hypothetical protein